MDHRIVDLHVHSTESDGTLTPEDLVAEAKKVGLAGFAPADRPAPSQAAGDGFMNIPDGIDEELPFN